MRILTALFVLVTLVQCKNLADEIGECPALELPQLTYGTHVYPIIDRTCAIPDCHSTGFEYGDFNQFSELKKRVDNGKLRLMVETGQMPHGFTDGPFYLNNCEIATIRKWIDQGAPNN